MWSLETVDVRPEETNRNKYIMYVTRSNISVGNKQTFYKIHIVSRLFRSGEIWRY
jgi:hypothetical protein